jgi:uncharacterized protein (TIGR00730 family)
VRHLTTVCVYAGSNPGNRPAYGLAAQRLGRTLAERRLRVVYGGGDVGLMGELADAALAAGAEVIGVIPQALLDREVGHGALTELRVVDSMHERKMAMAELSDAFIALPGGIGTIEELVEVLTWTQLGFHHKPVALLDVEGYYRPFAAFLDHAAHEGFLPAEHRAMLLTAEEPEVLLDGFARWEAPPVKTWIDRESA